jgi:hypothetical protein
MHSYNNYYYNRFNIEHDLTCLCGDVLPPEPSSFVQNHILQVCDEYCLRKHQHILCKVSQDSHIPILLGSAKGLLATAQFLLKTGAFTKSGQVYHPP